MANDLIFHFRPEHLQEILNTQPEYVLVKGELVAITISGVSLSAMVVTITGYKNSAPTLQKPGCPVPPCVPGEQLTPSCTTAIEILQNSYETHNFEREFDLFEQ